MKAKSQYHAFLICLQEAFAPEELPITLDLAALAARLRIARRLSKRIDKSVTYMTCLGKEGKHQEELGIFLTRAATQDVEGTGIAIAFAPDGQITLSQGQPPDGSLDDVKMQGRFR